MVARFFMTAGSALVALFLCVAALSAGAIQQLPTEEVTVTRQDGTRVAFVAELALDDDQRAIGLMNRTSLAANAAMLFDFGKSRRVTMWMKDTLIPLDMLFADENGVVVRIKRMAVPESLAIIDSRTDVRFVLEVPGGTADRLGLAAGDQMDSARIRLAKP